jgi:hypothetical protein
MSARSTIVGITLLHLGRKEAAFADFTLVIDAATATDEQRAAVLNNRTVVYDKEGEVSSAIADRTAVLSLGETTYDRRSSLSLGGRVPCKDSKIVQVLTKTSMQSSQHRTLR